jgi:lipoate-protein ligase A
VIPACARWLDLGVVEPVYFHALYQAVAESGGPAVLLGQVDAHFCLGQSQSRSAELAQITDVSVLRRPLGGGMVWVDAQQLSVLLLAPRGGWGRRPADWSAAALAPMIRTCQRFGLDVARHGEDLWLDGARIAGSGSASLGHCDVVASSFLLRFDARAFARGVRPVSAGFSDWLAVALADAVRDWASWGVEPAMSQVKQVFREELRRTLGWQLEDSRPTPQELAELPGFAEELQTSPQETGARRVPQGIKLRRGLYLTEAGGVDDWARVLCDTGILVRAAAAAWGELPGLAGVPARVAPAAHALSGIMPMDQAQALAERICALAYMEETDT